jgi:hypothetical protein
MSRFSRNDELIVTDGRRSVGHARPSRPPDGFVSPIKRLIVCCDGEICLSPLFCAPISGRVLSFLYVLDSGFGIGRSWVRLEADFIV